MAMTFDRNYRYRADGRGLLIWLATGFANAIRREWEYRRTMRALHVLDDRGLKDIGLVRTSVGYERISDGG
ncbi:DUF1127 domain-containing protein [Roseibium sp.]|uniref:DUF1127 domain-containing protein n=1 Tax=Roseibium sp. TaxID=1936156 RepID=UPI003A96CDA3